MCRCFHVSLVHALGNTSQVIKTIIRPNTVNVVDLPAVRDRSEDLFPNPAMEVDDLPITTDADVPVGTVCILRRI